MRLFLISVLLAIAIGCGFGFLATLEPPGWPLLRIVYLFVGMSCLVGMGRLLFVHKLSN